MIAGITLALIVAKPNETTFDVYQRSKPVGSATIQVSFGPDGSKETTTKLDVQIKGNRLTILRVTKIDRLGQTLYDNKTYSGSAKPVQLNATFSAKGDVELVRKAGGSVTKSNIRFARIGSRKDESELWVPGHIPGNGYWFNFITFQTDSAQWTPVRATYVGKKSVRVANRTVNAHIIQQQIKDQTQVIWLDEKGELLQLKDLDTLLVRKWR